ncbi:periplasmic protein thiol--disulphide oxidoreductase DsbE [Methylobacterium sp. 4-46]|uniref:DsbE family thiol:disulfide interchange protein n=1 Tax=unclassified Methylobacterium TaxID=2615210 RepID=UPI000152D302|nr:MULTISPECIES: DsbE family thiol:disulfide interchange protein [Methylobacterium]ACA18039.1 periplasmic protein thiol--disulphide oxidoreductase DsbE [Methylobacterium sp. 4-46]WFT77341.1 DsbE family thiol:disulfide interchange protein [Methylobacterium nodulans]
MSAADEAEAASARRGRILFLLPLVVFLALAGIFLGRLLTRGYDPSAVPSALIGRPAPAFALPGLPGLAGQDGPVPGLASADFAGKVTVLNVWASWCAPCQIEHPMLMRLSRDGVNLVGIDYKDAPENGRRFLGRHGNPFRAVGMDESGRVGIDFGVYGVPETFIIGPDGRIRDKLVGILTAENYESFLEKVRAAAK